MEVFAYHYHGSEALPPVVQALLKIGVLREAAVAWFVCVAGIKEPWSQATYWLLRVGAHYEEVLGVAQDWQDDAPALLSQWCIGGELCVPLDGCNE